MTQIKQKIDAVVKNLKAVPEFSKVRFVREYTDKFTETPISGFLAAVCVKSTELCETYLGGLIMPRKKGKMYRAVAEIRVYAPKNQNGSGLSELVGEMMYRLEDADEENIITGAKAGAIEFDENVSAVFRRLTFTVEFFEGGEEQNG